MFYSFLAFTQTSSEVGVFAGGSIYYGDLAKNHGSTKEIGFATGIMGRYMFNRKMGAKATLALANLSGSDATLGRHISRDWAFDNRIIEATVQFEYHPIGRGRRNFVGMFNKYKVSPYVFFGGGVSWGEPNVIVPAKDESRFPEQVEAVSNFVVAPVGGGIRFDLSKYSILSAEFGKRVVFSDYIDGISINGNSATNDWYAFGTISLSILLDAQIDRKF